MCFPFLMMKSGWISEFRSVIGLVEVVLFPTNCSVHGGRLQQFTSLLELKFKRHCVTRLVCCWSSNGVISPHFSLAKSRIVDYSSWNHVLTAYTMEFPLPFRHAIPLNRATCLTLLSSLLAHEKYVSIVQFICGANPDLFAPL